ncbi:MAG: hypothetical protein M1814_000948 [Vezdaea aestivalis]|nr:MAG: hypothetical protein M1814_000948 [Vezdaea aestivalis]
MDPKATTPSTAVQTKSMDGKPPASPTATTTTTTQDQRAQPWKELMKDINAEAGEFEKRHSSDPDMYDVEEGFNYHGIGG